MFPYETIKNQLVSLVEVNSGMRDSKGFKQTLENVFNHFVEIIKKLPVGMQIQAIGKNRLKGSSDIYFYSKHADSNMDLQYHNISIKFIGSDNPPNETRKIIFPSARMNINQDKFLEIVIYVNNEANKQEMLDKLEILKLNISHELVHVFKELYGQYQKDEKEFLIKNTNEIDWKKYLNDPSELEAFTAQIISELDNIH